MSKFSNDPNSDILQLVVENVFVHLKLPQEDSGKQTK
jgi:hypothetical protein